MPSKAIFHLACDVFFSTLVTPGKDSAATLGILSPTLSITQVKLLFEKEEKDLGVAAGCSLGFPEWLVLKVLNLAERKQSQVNDRHDD